MHNFIIIFYLSLLLKINQLIYNKVFKFIHFKNLTLEYKIYQ